MITGETIVAIATPAGRGGVGILRLSGKDLQPFIAGFLPVQLEPRRATYTDFYGNDGVVIDTGIAIYFPAPHSFTGEAVLELQAHGGPVILDMLLQHAIHLGARVANPGEFSERAFLNDKIDLAQAEAIADLIDASTVQAARSAIKSLQGEFSRQINTLVSSIIELRVYVESAIDFPEEEIDFLTEGKVEQRLADLLQQLNAVLDAAQQGALMREGMSVVLVGKPNAGKSSLLNALCGHDSAIVTDIAGTTRDVLREHIHIDGMPLHLVDTAGLRETDNPVEQEGIRRAWREVEQADRVLYLVDSSEELLEDLEDYWPDYFQHIDSSKPCNITFVFTKTDLSSLSVLPDTPYPCICLSAKTGQGLDLLRHHLKECRGFSGQEEGSFMARRRHLQAMGLAQQYLNTGKQQLSTQWAGELLAEDLRQAQQALSTITGSFTSDDLLGEIFSSFCIGK